MDIPPLDQTKKSGMAGSRRRMEMTMKLNLIFIAMDLLTLLAYPIVFINNKFRKLSKPYEIPKVMRLLAFETVIPNG
jgi:hypothetical protein